MSMSTLLKRGVLGATTAMPVCTGAMSASADWSQTTYDGNSVSTVRTDRAKIWVRDAKADGNRAYANYWRNNSSSRYQLVTYSYGEVKSATMAGSARVASFQACTDHPVAGDACNTRQYI